MSYTPDSAKPWYSAMDNGILADGSTDDTAAWNALFAKILTNGGGTAYLPPGRTSLCSGALLPIPYVNNTTNQPSLRITGSGPPGPGDTGLTAVGAGILDLRYNGENAVLNITATGGTYSLNYNGSATASINYNDNAGTIQTRLQATPSGGSLTVSGTNPFTITGSGLPLSATTTSLTGGTATITNNAVAKIDTRNHGQLEIDHLTLKSGGSDDYPFFQTTNTAVYGHDLMIQGHTANSGTGCVQDGFNLGGLIVNVSTNAAGNSDAIFQGYSTRFERVSFENIRIGFNCRAAANGCVFNANVFSSTCGGDTTHGAFTAGSAALPATNNTYNDNLIEITHYPYAFVFIASAVNNTGVGNGLYDQSGTSLATCSDASGNTGNRFLGTYSSISGRCARYHVGHSGHGQLYVHALCQRSLSHRVPRWRWPRWRWFGQRERVQAVVAAAQGEPPVRRRPWLRGRLTHVHDRRGRHGFGRWWCHERQWDQGARVRTTTFAGPTNLLAPGGGGGGGGVPSGNTSVAGAWSLASQVATANINGPGIGGVSIAGVVGTAGPALSTLPRAAGVAGASSGAVRAAMAAVPGLTPRLAQAQVLVGDRQRPRANGLNAAANTGGGGGGAGCGDANTGGTGEAAARGSSVSRVRTRRTMGVPAGPPTRPQPIAPHGPGPLGPP